MSILSESARRPARYMRSLFDLPSEQLVALARFAFAGFAYLAIYLDPSQPARNSEITYAILFAYFLYSGALTVIAFWLPLREEVKWGVHIIDIVTFSVLMHFTDGPTSPFFVFFTFALLAAMLRWDWPGVIMTTIVLVGILVLISYVGFSSAPEGDDEVNRLIVRATYLFVAGAILAYASAIRQRDRERVRKLAAWPQEDVAASDHPALAVSLRHAASVIAARRVLVIWDDEKEPHLQMALWDGETCQFKRWESTTPEPVIELSLQDTTFFAASGTARSVTLRSGRRHLPTSALLPEFAERFTVKRFSCAPFSGQYVRGWYLILDPPPLFENVHALSDILAARIGVELEHFCLRLELTRAAVARERERLARNMHDGILQNLTAAGLQLTALSSATPQAAGRIDKVAQILVDQQEMIREFVQALNPKPRGAEIREVESQLRAFAEQVGKQWDCIVETEVSPPELHLPESLIVELCLMLSEATANAVRHGQARKLVCFIRLDAARLSIAFRDDGRGILTAESRARRDPIPFSLGQRVRDLSGRLTVPSVSEGFALDIELPCDAR
jgi:signal transduction histidine kinase